MAKRRVRSEDVVDRMVSRIQELSEQRNEIISVAQKIQAEVEEKEKSILESRRMLVRLNSQLQATNSSIVEIAALTDKEPEELNELVGAPLIRKQDVKEDDE